MLNPKDAFRTQFFWIAESVAEVAAVNTNGTKILFADGLSIFFIKGKPVFSDGPRSLPKNPPNCAVLDNWVFNNFILAENNLQKFSP